MNNILPFGRVSADYRVVKHHALVAVENLPYGVNEDRDEKTNLGCVLSFLQGSKFLSFWSRGSVLCLMNARSLPSLSIFIMNDVSSVIKRSRFISPLLLAPRFIGRAIFFTPMKSVSEPYNV